MCDQSAQTPGRQRTAIVVIHRMKTLQRHETRASPIRGLVAEAQLTEEGSGETSTLQSDATPATSRRLFY